VTPVPATGHVSERLAAGDRTGRPERERAMKAKLVLGAVLALFLAGAAQAQISVKLGVMRIGSADDAELAVQRIRAAIIEQIATEATLRRAESRFGRPTDLSHALSSATAMLLAAPFRSRRSVINIIGNGPDNVNEDSQGARDAALALGFTINGVVLGHDPDVIAYFQQNVVGGPGSFVEHVPSPEGMAEVLRRKFINDIVIGFADGSEPEPDH